MKKGNNSPRRIAKVMLHTSPLEQAGSGDAGGMNVYVVESAKRMALSGVEVDIYTRASSPDLPKVVEIAPGVQVRHLYATPYKDVTKSDIVALMDQLERDFLQNLKELGEGYYQIIHSHYWISGMLAKRVSEKSGIPFIHTFHTSAKVKNLSLAENESPEPLSRAIGEEELAKSAKALIANTDSEAASLVSLYNACPENVYVATPGVNLKEFTVGIGKKGARTKLGIAAEKIVLSFIGRIQPHKGPDVLIRAVAEMIAHSPKLRNFLEVLIIGGASGSSSGSSEVERLKSLARWLGVADVITFMPPVARQDLADWYRVSDLVCVPSYSESFGLVALEAQACGTPVVATAVGGLRAAVADGFSGSLVDGHDPKAWSAVLMRLIAQPERRLILSMGAVDHASHFGWDQTARTILDVYDGVLSDSQRVHGEILNRDFA
ncbi:MAG: D-inositol-3-phosphate glycosyltransferase [Actinobacteria bacterium]|nr:D-inositol-3-phosphate glycosyltransferase [Actinomycetota bacterium]